MRLVVGLGNPGERYRRTRHNAGFMVVDALASRWQVGPFREQADAAVAPAVVAGAETVLAKPLTFMNRSGLAVGALMEGLDATPADLLVVVDDVALELGVIRVRERGGHGNHNGLRSIVDTLATEEFARLRLGIRKGEPPEDLAAYVLSDFPQDDVLVVQEAVGQAADAVEIVLRDGAAAAMNRFNGLRVG
jgi:PTH1 family peptidyl-tRNA hydrolase